MAKGVIFDLDGTLLDTLGDICAALNKTLQKHGFAEVTLDECRGMIGDGEKRLIWRAFPADLPDELKEGALADYRTAYASSLTVFTHAFDGINILLDDLERKAVPYAVFTNKSQPLAERLLGSFFPGRSFALVIGQGGVHPLKPNPAAVNEIARRFGISCADILLVGDSTVDMEAAKRADAVGIGACWGYQSIAALGEARRLVSKPEDVCALIPYTIGGTVAHGSKLGGTIGLPTANLHVNEAERPPEGVYASIAAIENRLYLGVTNIGARPTVTDAPTIKAETHILDYSGDLYGKTITVELYNKLRDTVKFPGLPELKAQITKDISAAREALAGYSSLHMREIFPV